LIRREVLHEVERGHAAAVRGVPVSLTKGGCVANGHQQNRKNLNEAAAADRQGDDALDINPDTEWWVLE